MTDSETVEKAIKIAIGNGWQPIETIEGSDVVIQQWQGHGMLEVCFYKDSYEHNPMKWVRELEGIIYNHDFAKALWGVEEVDHFDLVDLDNGGKTSTVTKPIWHYHLQKMVVADDPIGYLRDNLPLDRGPVVLTEMLKSSYSLEDLKTQFVLPILRSIDERPIEEVADGIIEIIKQDREASGASG